MSQSCCATHWNSDLWTLPYLKFQMFHFMLVVGRVKVLAKFLSCINSSVGARCFCKLDWLGSNHIKSSRLLPCHVKYCFFLSNLLLSEECSYKVEAIEIMKMPTKNPLKKTLLNIFKNLITSQILHCKFCTKVHPTLAIFHLAHVFLYIHFCWYFCVPKNFQ